MGKRCVASRVRYTEKMLQVALIAYAARIRNQRRAHPDVSEPALAPEFQRLLNDCLPLLPAAPALSVIPEFTTPGVGRPDIALKRAGEPARGFVELKHPAKPADPERWKDVHDKRQYSRFRTLGCWAASNFAAIHLFERDREVAVATVVPKAALDPDTPDAKAEKAIKAQDEGALVTLLTRLAQAQAPRATNARELAANLAYAARLVRGIVADRLAELKAAGEDDHPLLETRGQFRDVLYAHPEAGGYSGASFDELFAAAFAQTLGFGLLLVREASGQAVDEHAAGHMPDEHPLMKSALQVLTLPQIRHDLGIGFEVMLDTVNSFAAELLVPGEDGRDPILYFYEDFLAVFDPKARERYGVYYTPVEVVRYMVGALDRALRDDLGTDGLGDPAVTVLDPAVGTGTFLLGVAERVKAQAGGAGAAHLDLLDLAKRMYGFELLVGPYAVAHYRLHHALRPPVKSGEPEPEKLPRLGIYLADTLARPETGKVKGTGGFLFKGIAEERAEASRIKSEQPILAIIGNPPYRRLEVGENETLVGRWMDEKWDDLKRPVRDAGWGGELNTFPELSVAFWRWAMWKLFEAENAPKRGVVAFITNRKFLTGHPYAGLRKMMREQFDRIEVIDLRGDIRRGERAGVVRDEGVFNIQVGTCITLAIADGSRAGEAAEVFYSDAWSAGLTARKAKLDWLESGADAGTLPGAVEVTRGAMEDMRPGPFEGGAWVSLAQCFSTAGLGVQSKRDSFSYALREEELVSRLKEFVSLPLRDAQGRFNETAPGRTEKAQAEPFDKAKAVTAAYRPLDRRILYNHTSFIDRRRPELQAAWGAENICMYTMPSGIGEGPAVWAHGLLPDYHAFRGSYGGYAFPLYDRRLGGDQINLSPALLAGLAAAYGVPLPPQDVFDAILALLSATSYTTTFAEDLEDVFPHVPFPGDHQVFLDAAAIGREIRAVETFARKPGPVFLPSSLARLDTPPSAGSLGAVTWAEGAFALRPDGSGEVTGVSEAVWRFQVSGYRLLPRWLAAREGQPVDKALITAMRDVAGRIAETIHWFDKADLVLNLALAHTVTRHELGLAPAPATVGDESDI